MELLALEKIRQRQFLLSSDNIHVKLEACFKSIPEIVFKNGCDALASNFVFRKEVLDLSRQFSLLFRGDYDFILNE